MSELKELINRIEELRTNLIEIQIGKSYTDPDVVSASQKLDTLLDKYQVLMMNKPERIPRIY